MEMGAFDNFSQIFPIISFSMATRGWSRKGTESLSTLMVVAVQPITTKDGLNTGWPSAWLGNRLGLAALLHN